MELEVYIELSIPGDHEVSHLYGAMNTGRTWSCRFIWSYEYREIMELGFIWSYEYRDIMEPDVYMELSIPGDLKIVIYMEL